MCAGGPVDVGGGLVDVEGGGEVLWRMAWIILMMPATPAAAWVWPMLDLMEPSQSGLGAVLAVGVEEGLGFDGVAESGAGAVGFDGVMSWGWSRALGRAWWMTRCWAGPLGAVSPLEAPSWLMALPRRMARTWWLLRRASESRSTSNNPTPSLQPVPFADAENDRHRPSGDSPRCRLNSTNVCRRRHHRHPAGEGEVALAVAERLGGEVQGDQ